MGGSRSRARRATSVSSFDGDSSLGSDYAALATRAARVGAPLLNRLVTELHSAVEAGDDARAESLQPAIRGLTTMATIFAPDCTPGLLRGVIDKVGACLVDPQRGLTFPCLDDSVLTVVYPPLTSKDKFEKPRKVSVILGPHSDRSDLDASTLHPALCPLPQNPSEFRHFCAALREMATAEIARTSQLVHDPVPAGEDAPAYRDVLNAAHQRVAQALGAFDSFVQRFSDLATQLAAGRTAHHLAVQAILVRLFLVIWFRAALNDNWLLLNPTNWYEWVSAEAKPWLELHPQGTGGLRVTVEQALLFLGYRCGNAKCRCLGIPPCLCPYCGSKTELQLALGGGPSTKTPTAPSGDTGASRSAWNKRRSAAFAAFEPSAPAAATTQTQKWVAFEAKFPQWLKANMPAAASAVAASPAAPASSTAVPLITGPNDLFTYLESRQYLVQAGSIRASAMGSDSA